MKINRLILAVFLVVVLLAGQPGSHANASGTSSAVSIVNLSYNDTTDVISFDVNLQLVGYTPGATGIDLYIRYNDAIINPPAASTGTITDYFGVTFVPFNTPEACPPPNSADECIHLAMVSPTGQSDKDAAIASYTFTALADGTACFEIVQVALTDENGPTTPTPTMVYNSATGEPGDCVATDVTDPGLDGFVYRQGMTAATNSACTLVERFSAAVSQETVYTGDTGAYDFGLTAVGSYDIKAYYPGYLDADTSPEYGLTQSSTISTPTLVGGDSNGDNAINILDVGAVLSDWGTITSSIGSADAADCAAGVAADNANDINDDGAVNIGDLAIIVGNFGEVGPTTWVP